MIDALRRAGLSRNPVASGRTDAGVHARMQVLSFRVVEPISTPELAERINAHLPPTMGIALAKEAPPHFNAHWRAELKEYRYRLVTADAPEWRAAAWAVGALDLDQLQKTLDLAVGTHDFYAFHDKSSVVRARTVRAIDVRERAGLVEVRLHGEGFGRYMVRYLIGGAVAVARGAWTREGFSEALSSGSSRERPEQLVRAPAQGLVLWSVDYPAADDPFTTEERERAAGVPSTPPFCAP